MFAPRLAATCFVAALLLGSSVLAGPATTETGAGGVRWRSWDEGLREAASSKRPVLVDVYTDWCGWCRRMERDVYAQTDVAEYLSRRFVTVKINAESRASASYEGHDHTLRSLAQRFGVRGYPTSVFLRSGGEHIVNVSGYVPAERFLRILRYIGDGHLDRGASFEDFDKQAGGSSSGER